MKRMSFIALVTLLVPISAFAQDPLATSQGYLEAIIPIALVIAIILFFAFLGSNY